MTDRPELTAAAIHRLTVVTDPWLSCDDCFDALDTVVEDVIARGLAMDEPFAVHLNGCSVCSEEALSLASLVAPELGLDPDEALQVLQRAVRTGVE
ncbi:MAG TPA: hypothetical protein VGE14_14360 [Marmoricola sp.]